MVRAALCLLALTLLPDPGASQARRPLSYDDYYRIERVGGVALSPDGGRVAFVRTRVIEEENATRSEVWMVDANGSGEPYRITPPSTEGSAPRWSPDGTLLAYRVGSTWALARMDRPGGGLVAVEELGGAPLFDPTGRWIAFTRPVPPDGPRPEPPAPTSEEEAKIARRFDGRAYDWMNYRFDRRGYLPDPRDPWATPPEQIFVLPRGGDGEARRITSLDVDASSPAWRPDGGTLAFVADAHARDERTYERADLWTVTLDGALTRLTDDDMSYRSPAWSPDGRSVAVLGHAGLDAVIRERWDHGAPTDVLVFPEGGGEPRNVTGAWDLIPGAPEWSPDGRSIYVTAQVGGASHLFRVPAGGGGVEQVTTGDVRVSDVSFDRRHARMAYTVQSPVEPGDVYVAPVGRAGVPAASGRRLTDVNRELLDALKLRGPERILYESADGTPIEGWVLPPVGYRADGGPYPMILNIHGGPHGAYGWEFSFDRHLQSANGYFALYTNPRASTGYGEAFRWGTWGSWGEEDYDDVMAGVDHVLGRYPVDEARLGVTGYSYGGYLTNRIITRTHRFAAAVAGASISNWVSDYGTADIPRTKESEFYGPPWEEEGLRNLLAASPVVHAKGVTTPTLFVHGESDHRVPIAEAEQMYVALRKQEVPARFIRYPESYHGGWTPWRYVHRLWSTIEWFDEWLPPRPAS